MQTKKLLMGYSAALFAHSHFAFTSRRYDFSCFLVPCDIYCLCSEYNIGIVSDNLAIYKKEQNPCAYKQNKKANKPKYTKYYWFIGGMETRSKATQAKQNRKIDYEEERYKKLLENDENIKISFLHENKLYHNHNLESI